MDDKKQINNASLLADIQPAEKLDTARAQKFVSSVMKSEKRSFRLVFSISASAILVAAAIAAVVMISGSEIDSFGTPSSLYEDAYIHASAAAADSTHYMQSDSLTIKCEAQE